MEERRRLEQGSVVVCLRGTDVSGSKYLRVADSKLSSQPEVSFMIADVIDSRSVGYFRRSGKAKSSH